MTTINNIEDLARILEEHPHWVETFRTLLLTKELLGLPAIVAELTERLAQLTAIVEQIRRDVAELKTGQDELRAGQDELRTGQDELRTGQDELRAGQNGLDVRLSRLENNVAALRGDTLENTVHHRARPRVAEEFNLRRVRVVQSISQETLTELTDRLDDAIDDHLISWNQRRRIDETDLILHGHSRTEPVPIWVAVEVSSRVKERDIVRARQSADILATLFGETAQAAVAGHQIDPLDLDRAQANDVKFLEIHGDL